jgi:NADPH:quinone reductase-like Zn-dependent oxidoreductase
VELSFAEAACLPTAWLTAYRMLFVNSGLRPGQTVLVQGATGGVASAAITMARAAGFQVWATARTEEKQQVALDLGAHQSFASGARLPGKVDAVMETVGEATWSHSARALRPGGRIVICGATSGQSPSADLNRLFFLQLQVVGSTMGTRAELHDLMAFLVATGIRPRIDRILPLADAAEGLAAMESSGHVGKIVLDI